MSNNRTAPIKPTFQMSCNEGQFDVVEVINLNAQHVNGMTHFDFSLHVRLLDTLIKERDRELSSHYP